MMSKEEQGDDGMALSHHLSKEAQERLPNSMKVFLRSMEDTPNLISLANGDPPPSLYPLAQVDFHVPAIGNLDCMDSWFTRDCDIEKISVSDTGKSAIDISVAMQYGTGLGLAKLREQLEEFNSILHGPSLTTRKAILSLGNADAVTKIYRLLGTPGDTFLVEEYSFCGLTNAPIAQGIRWQPVKIDEYGLIPQDMEEILGTWDENTRGRRPHVLYCIPTGQNPTGATLPAERRRAIYAIAQKYDVIILEDDPYYFLHYDVGSHGSDLISTDPSGLMVASMKNVAPSFLSLDVDGRVIRVDTVSKVIAPNMRLGWITCNALFSRKLEILTDNSTQHPHGLGQALLAEILSPAGWGIRGYLVWANVLKAEYRRRRDLFFRVFQEEVGEQGLADTQLPVAGLFFWIRIHLEVHPRYVVDCAQEVGPKTNTRELVDELFKLWLKGGLLIMPGVLFAMEPTDKLVAERVPSENHILDKPYVRATFVGADDTIENGLRIFGKVLKEFFVMK